MRHLRKQLRLLYVDDHLLAVSKPPGVHALPTQAGEPAVTQLLGGHPDWNAPGALAAPHRLDRDASGVQLYARTPVAESALVRQFEQQAAERIYLALVCGYVAAAGEVTLQLTFNKKLERVEATPFRGKAARTSYRILERLPGNTLLECHALPDWPQQVRAHLASLGHPLTIDPVYGGGEAVLLSRYKPDYRSSARHAERPLIDRLTLHALAVTLPHPVLGTPLHLQSPWPKDLRATVTQLGRLVSGP